MTINEPINTEAAQTPAPETALPTQESLVVLGAPAETEVVVSEPKISIDQFHTVDIRVGEILSATKVENADKLLRLEVRFGGEVRQIVSGIAPFYTDISVLVGMRVAFVYNLEPRTIRGLESNGMILAALDSEGKFTPLLAPGVASGTQVS